MKMITLTKRKFLIALSLVVVLGVSCSKDDPKKESTPELITKVTLTFTETSVVGGPGPVSGPVVVSATDPDGEGVQNLIVEGPINLIQGTTYVMSIELINALVASGQPGYNITDEVADEGDEHQFFFSWSDNPFSDPAGDGNIDNPTDPLNYSGGPTSKDPLGHNLGITTTWTTVASTVAGGTFRILLKHQPGLKTATSASTVGETDLDLTFTITVQ